MKRVRVPVGSLSSPDVIPFRQRSAAERMMREKDRGASDRKRRGSVFASFIRRGSGQRRCVIASLTTIDATRCDG